MKRSELAAALAFLLFGSLLWSAAAGFPPGVGGLPGPGFFPRGIAAVMVALAAAWLARARRRPSGPPSVPATGAPQAKRVVLTVILLAAHLALWGRVPFPLRTFLFAALYLRCFDEPWRRALPLALGSTASVVAAFEYGLGVSLP